MEIKDYVRIIKNNIWAILIIIVIFVGMTLIFTAKKAVSYDASSTIEVVRAQSQDQSKVPYYQYDNYYSGLAAGSLSDNMIGWIASPSTVAEIFAKANYPLPSSDLKTLSKTFTARKSLSTSAVVTITYSSTDKEKAAALVSESSSILKEKIQQYNKVDTSANFNSIVGNTVVIEAPKNYTINLLLAAFVGILISLSYAFLKESLRK